MKITKTDYRKIQTAFYRSIKPLNKWHIKSSREYVLPQLKGICKLSRQSIVTVSSHSSFYSYYLKLSKINVYEVQQFTPTGVY